jgi:hypothetical protein
VAFLYFFEEKVEVVYLLFYFIFNRQQLLNAPVGQTAFLTVLLKVAVEVYYKIEGEVLLIF